MGEGDLAACGFSDDDMNFLSIAGPAMDEPGTDELTRALIAREMARITGRNLSQGTTKRSSHSDLPATPGGGELAERQAAERRAFLRKLGA